MNYPYVFELFTAAAFHDALSYVKKHEYRCVNLAEQLLHCVQSTDNPSYKHAAILYKQCRKERIVKECKAIVFLTNHDILLHCIDEELPLEIVHELAHLFLQEALACSHIHAIIGLRIHTVCLETVITDFFKMSFAFSQDYYLMQCSNIVRPFLDPMQVTLPFDCITVEKATVDDVASLFPLQTAYERDEVTYNGIEINPRVCKLALYAQVRKSFVYKVSVDSHIVAKAGINAFGINCFQIGGVYTLPEWRNHGLASFLVAHMVHAHLQEKAQAIIFVKLSNQAAVQVYTKVGFKHCGLFRLTYVEMT
ncbi:MAG: GNAT family N-acetyltransferase [Treponema sp.]